MTIPNVQHFFEPLSARRRSNIENLFDNFLSDFYISSLPNIKWEGQFLLPRLDVIETESNYQMDLEMPGIEQKNIDINVENNTLTLCRSITNLVLFNFKNFTCYCSQNC